MPPDTSEIHQRKLLHIPVEINADAPRERRKFRRVNAIAPYSTVVLRVLTVQKEPLEGHVLNLSESGMAVELDQLLASGTPVVVEFTLAGLGRLRLGHWPTMAAACEVIRCGDLEDFPNGPYQVALRFVRVGTMVRAQIARYVAGHRG